MANAIALLAAGSCFVRFSGDTEAISCDGAEAHRQVQGDGS